MDLARHESRLACFPRSYRGDDWPQSEAWIFNLNKLCFWLVSIANSCNLLSNEHIESLTSLFITLSLWSFTCW